MIKMQVSENLWIPTFDNPQSEPDNLFKVNKNPEFFNMACIAEFLNDREIQIFPQK